MRWLAIVLVVAWLMGIGAVGGIGAESPQPSPEPPPYPDGTAAAFERVGPSMWRVIESDPDCDRLPPYSADSMEIASDGRAWTLDIRGTWELGSCPILGPHLSFGIRAQALAPDGTLWVLEGDRLMSWNGEDWDIHAEGEFNVPECDALGGGPDTPEGVQEHGGACSTDCEEQACYFTLDVAPDGTIWLSGDIVSAYDGGAWTHYPEAEHFHGFGPDGVVWVRGRDGLYVIRS
jgi:hypothetical protein